MSFTAMNFKIESTQKSISRKSAIFKNILRIYVRRRIQSFMLYPIKTYCNPSRQKKSLCEDRVTLNKITLT
jgi:hypothetical protein